MAQNIMYMCSEKQKLTQLTCKVERDDKTLHLDIERSVTDIESTVENVTAKVVSDQVTPDVSSDITKQVESASDAIRKDIKEEAERGY